MSNPFRYFNSSPEVIRLVVMMYVRYPLSLRNVEDLLAERGIDISHETVRFWWNRFGSIFAAGIRKRPIMQMRAFPQLALACGRGVCEGQWQALLSLARVDHEGECPRSSGMELMFAAASVSALTAPIPSLPSAHGGRRSSRRLRVEAEVARTVC